MPPLPPNWDMHKDGVKAYYINQKTQQRVDTRPVCQRESIKQLLNVINDIFTGMSVLVGWYVSPSRCLLLLNRSIYTSLFDTWCIPHR